MTTAAYVVLSLSVVSSWVGLIALAMHFSRAHARLLRSNDDLTSQIIAFKNPGAAMLFAQQQHAVAAQHRASLEEQVPEADDEILG